MKVQPPVAATAGGSFSKTNSMSDKPQTLELVVTETGIDAASADVLRDAFAPMFTAAKQWQQRVDGLVVTDISQTLEMKLARESRLALKEIRCNAERQRKKLKEESLRRGKAIDGIYNVLEYLVTPLEEQLLAMEQFAERKEQARLDAQLVERKSALAYYGQQVFEDKTLREMGDEAYNEMLEGARLLAEARQREAERKEQERIAKEKAEAEERERVRLENERLKAEAAKREEQMRLEREAAAKAALEEQARRDEQLRQERELAAATAREAEAKAKAEKAQALAAERAKHEAEASAARAEAAKREEQMRLERERLEKEQLRLAEIARVEAEARRKAEQELATQRAKEVEAKAKAKAESDAAAATARRASSAPDKDRLQAYMDEISKLKMPEMKSEAGIAVAGELMLARGEFMASIRHFSQKL